MTTQTVHVAVSDSALLVLPGAAMWDAGGGYAGGDLYVGERAVADRAVVTAGPQSPVQFARATLALLDLAPETVLDAYERVFSGGDTTAFPILMGAAA